jgi:hypothetical protein
MRYCALFLTISAFAQPSETSSYTYDSNGRRVLESVSRNGGQAIPSINGRIAPLEKVEEKVISDDSTGKVIERTIRPFDPTGNPGPPQKLRIAERKAADGSVTVETQVYHANVSGSFALVERSNATTRKTGDQTVTDVQIARPTLNGSLDTVERRNSTVTKSGENESADTTTYRRDSNGSFYAAVREVKQTEKAGGKVVENTSTYLATGGRQMQLDGQTVAEITKKADGSEVRQVSIYGVNLPGRPVGTTPVLREVQTIEKAKTTSGTVESTLVRRPSIDNPKSLGPATKINERVCTGACQ